MQSNDPLLKLDLESGRTLALQPIGEERIAFVVSNAKGILLEQPLGLEELFKLMVVVNGRGTFPIHTQEGVYQLGFDVHEETKRAVLHRPTGPTCEQEFDDLLEWFNFGVWVCSALVSACEASGRRKVSREQKRILVSADKFLEAVVSRLSEAAEEDPEVLAEIEKTTATKH